MVWVAVEKSITKTWLRTLRTVRDKLSKVYTAHTATYSSIVSTGS